MMILSQVQVQRVSIKSIVLGLKLLVMTAVVLVSLPSMAANYNLTLYAGKKLSQASELAQKEHLPKAIAVLKSAKSSTDYDNAFINRVLGIYYWQAEQPKSSITVLRKSLAFKALEPKTQWQANRMLGDILYSQQQFSQAAKEYRNTLAVKYVPVAKEKSKYNQDTNDIKFRLAAAYYQQQKWSQVRQWIVRYRAPDASKRLQALRMQVIAELQLKQWSRAESTLTRLIRMQPNDKTWWLQQISTQLQQKKQQIALATYALAKKQNVDFKETDYKSLSQLYAQNKIPERAARVLDEMFKAYPKTKTEQNQKTQAYYWQMAREWPQAVEAWKALAQRNAKYYWPLTQLYIQQSDYKSAAKVIDKAKPYAKKEEFSLAKVRLLYRLEKYNDALAEAKRLNEEQPSDSAQTWIAYLQNMLQKQDRFS